MHTNTELNTSNNKKHILNWEKTTSTYSVAGLNVDGIWGRLNHFYRTKHNIKQLNERQHNLDSESCLNYGKLMKKWTKQQEHAKQQRTKEVKQRN